MKCQNVDYGAAMPAHSEERGKIEKVTPRFCLSLSQFLKHFRSWYFFWKKNNEAFICHNDCDDKLRNKNFRGHTKLNNISVFTKWRLRQCCKSPKSVNCHAKIDGNALTLQYIPSPYISDKERPHMKQTRRKYPYTPAATMCHMKGREVIKLQTLWPIWTE